jgi:shikimate 5-dehydrogenase
LDAETKGCKTILGLEMFLYQGLEQFILYTKKEAPEDKMRTFLDNIL